MRVGSESSTWDSEKRDRLGTEQLLGWLLNVHAEALCFPTAHLAVLLVRSSLISF